MTVCGFRGAVGRRHGVAPARWTIRKQVFIFASLCALFASVYSQGDPLSTQAVPYEDGVSDIPITTVLSTFPTDAPLVDKESANASVDAVTPSPSNLSAGGTTAKMQDGNFVVRVPTTPRPTDAPETPAEPPLDEPESLLVNTTIFEHIVKDFADKGGYNYSDPDTQCQIRTIMEPHYLDFDTDDGGTLCPSYFDEIHCWAASPPGVIERQCPESFHGIVYDTNDTVTRLCLFNGTWGNNNKSDYSQCTPLLNPKVVSAHDRAVDIIIYTGYSLSFTALLGALFILCYFKSLRCVRNYIHLNLVVSFLLLYIVFFLVIIINTASYATESKVGCRLQELAFVYLTLTNFFWMFVEGLYLHTMVVRALTVRREKFWVYCVIGWGVPLVFGVAHAITDSLIGEEQQEGVDCIGKNDADYIVRIPVIAVIVVNVCFMIHIIIILVTKLRASHSFETKQYRKGVRGIVVLLPLLGASYFMLLLEPSPEDPHVGTYVYRYLNAFLQSTQGFFVAIIYVYMNQEVQNAIKRWYKTRKEQSTLPRFSVGRGSRQNSMANNASHYKHGSFDDTMRTSIPTKTEPSEHVGNGRLNSMVKHEELLPLKPVPEDSPGLESTPQEWSTSDALPPEDKETTALTGKEQPPDVAEDDQLDGDGQIGESDQGGDTFVIDDQDQEIRIGSDEALIVHGNTPIMEQNPFLQDKLERENNNVHRNGLKISESNENLLTGQVSILSTGKDHFFDGEVKVVSDSPHEGNQNNSNNTQLPCILKTTRDKQFPGAKKHVAFVCPERESDFQMHPQQFFEENDFDASFRANNSLGFSVPSTYTCSTIASDDWTREADRSKWSPKILFKRPGGKGSPTSQRLVPASSDDDRNGRIKLPKSPAGTPV